MLSLAKLKNKQFIVDIMESGAERKFMWKYHCNRTAISKTNCCEALGRLNGEQISLAALSTDGIESRSENR